MKAIILTQNDWDAKRVYVQAVRDDIGKICQFDGKVYSKKDVLSNSKNFDDVEIIFSTWGMPKFSVQEIKEYLPKVKYLFYAAGSVQAFAKEFLECGVRVFSAWRDNAIPVIEYAVSNIILANKGFLRMVKKGAPRVIKYRFLTHTFGNYKSNIGLLGCGSIGSQVAKKLLEHDLNVFVYDPFLSDEKAKSLGVRKRDLDWIFKNCAVVSNHLANKKELENVIDYKLLKSMPKYSTFINTGRGAQVSEFGLFKALVFDKSKYALLDVTKHEPMSIFNPLRLLKNVIVTPHIAGSASSEVVRMSDGMIETCKAVLDGQSVDCEVVQTMLDTMA